MSVIGCGSYQAFARALASVSRRPDVPGLPVDDSIWWNPTEEQEELEVRQLFAAPVEVKHSYWCDRKMASSSHKPALRQYDVESAIAQDFWEDADLPAVKLYLSRKALLPPFWPSVW